MTTNAVTERLTLRLRIAGACLTVVIAMSSSPVLVGAGPESQDGSGEESVSRLDVGDLISRFLGREELDPPADQSQNLAERRFFIVPTAGGNPALGFAIGTLAAVTAASGGQSDTPISSTLLSATITTKKQLLVAMRSDISLSGNRWHLLGDWRYYKFRERTHGLGSDRPFGTFVDFDYEWSRVHQVVYRPLRAGFQVGAGYHLDVHADLQPADEQPAPVPLEPTAAMLESTVSSGVSMNLQLDRRDNFLNATRGVLGRASYTFYRTALGSDQNWESLQVEGRAYRRLPGARRHTVAAWGLGWLTRAGDPPYWDLPSTGWDTYGRTARGYRAGRFRGRSWVYVELEYRAELTRNGLLGAVAFVNASTLSDAPDGKFQMWTPGGGLGARLKIDKERESNLAIDVGWGRNGSRGVFFGLNEAF